MARRGEVGRAALVEPHQTGWLCGTGSFFVRFTREANRLYFLLLLRSTRVRKFLAGEAVGTTMVNLNHGIVKRTPLAIPPLAEQARIVAKVDELMSLCDQLEASLSRGENTRSRLLDALLHKALQPSRDNVIDLEAARRRRLEQRQAVGCRIVQRLAGKPGFGRVRAVKLQYLAEAHCGAALGGEWRRADYGPYDDWIRTFETQAAAAGWFSTREHASPDGNKRFEYQPRPGLSARAGEAAAALGDMAGEFERVLDLFAGLDTEDSEIVATLYAAWNDLLLEGKPVTDDIVIAEFREHWGVPRKAGFDSGRLRAKLDWMRSNRLVPKGQGPSTLRQQELF